MSLFYKTNLMNDFDPLLIVDKNDDLKKEQEKSEDDDVEENEIVEFSENTIQPMSYPLRHNIRYLLGLIMFLHFVFINFIFFVSKRDELYSGNNKHNQYLEPCNASNVMTLDEVYKFKNELDGLNTEKSAINIVMKYNMSETANKYLTAKLENLTTFHANFSKALEKQTEIRYNCYKQNLEKNCKAKTTFGFYTKHANFIHAFVISISILFSVSIYYFFKAKTLELSLGQKKLLRGDSESFIFIILFDIAFTICCTILSVFKSCDVTSELQQFSL